MINYLVLINVATELPMMLVALFDIVGCLCANPFRWDSDEEDAAAVVEKQTCISAPVPVVVV